MHTGGEIERCVFRGNTSDEYGGAVYLCHSFMEPVFPNCVISNCLIESNEAKLGGGAVYNRCGGPDRCFRNCTLVNNEAHSGSGVYNDYGIVRFSNCAIVNPGTNEITDVEEGETVVTYSLVAGGWLGEGNTDVDPLFVDAENGDFHLQPNSPCIDSGSVEGPAEDLDGNPRPVDVPGVGREGEGAFDMGAYEFQVPTPTPSPTRTRTPTSTRAETLTPTPTLFADERSDVNDDGRVNADDLLILLRDWKKVTGP